MGNYKLSEDISAIDIIPTTDIGGTNVQSNRLLVTNGDRIFCYVLVGSGNTDAITTAKLLQCKTSDNGDSSEKDLSTSGSGKQFDSATMTISAAGDTIVLEARAADLDVNNGFKYVSVYLASTADAGADAVVAVLMVHAAAVQRKELLVASSAHHAYIQANAN